MQTREIWFTYPTRDLPHKEVAICKTKLLGFISVTKPLLKQLKQENFFVKFAKFCMFQSLRYRRWNNKKICIE